MTAQTVGQGTLRTTAGRALPLERTEVVARLGGPVARVEVRQLFRNDGPDAIEAVYEFPLPHEASVHRMELRIADRVVRAVVREREEARRVYEQARSEGRAATLLEQDQPSLFTLSVANVPPGATIEVRLEYQELLGFDDGEWRFVFPLVAPERYLEAPPPELAAGTAAGGQGSAGSAAGAPRRGPRLPSGARADAVSLEVEVRSDAPVEGLRCASHPVEIEPLEAGAQRVRLSTAGPVANRDFVLSFRAAAPGVRPHAWFQREAGQAGTLLLALTPPGDELPRTRAAGAEGGMKALQCGNCGGLVTDLSSVREIPGLGTVVRCTFCGALLAPSTEPPHARATRPRDVTVLVDRSASMRASVGQARRAVRALLEALSPADGIQVLAFDHDRVAFDGDGSRFVALAPEVVSRIDTFLAELAPRGGTELEAALEAVAKLPVREGRTRLVVLITDASVGNEGRLLRRAPELLGPERRLFVLGLGPAVDRRLVERLARACGGASDTLLPDEDVEPVMKRFARRVRDGGPVLTGLSVSLEGAGASELYPAALPDLFGGQPVRLLGRFESIGPAKVVIAGATADGKPFRQELQLDLPAASDQVPGLERLWAKHKIDALLGRAERDPSSASSVKADVTALALRYALVTPHTSLVAEDSEVVARGAPRRVEVPAARPEGGEDVASAAAPAATEGGRSTGAFTLAAEMDGYAHVLDEHAVTRSGMAAPMGAAGAPPPPPRAPAPASHAAPGGPPPTFGAPSPAPAAPVAAARARAADAPLAPQARKGGFFDSIKRAVGIGRGAADAELEAADDDRAIPSEEPAPTIADRAMAPPYDAPTPASRPTPRQGAAPVARSPAPGEPPGSEPYDPAELAWVAARKVGELDLVFLVDETGSMGPHIAEVQAHLLSLIDALRGSPLCRSLRLGLVSYRDHAPQDHTYASRAVPLTDDLAVIERAVRELRASGGGDGPESVTDGLVEVVRLAWRQRAARAVVWFGDAPPHGVSPSGDAWPQGCPCGKHWYTQAESCREMGIAVYAVGCLPTLRHYAGGEEVYRTVASASRGLYLPLSDAHLLVPLIVGAAVTELDRQRVDEHVADAVAAHREALGRTDERERVRWLTEALRDEGVRPREMSFDPAARAAAPLRFRTLGEPDVQAALDRLRFAGRVDL